MKDKPLPDRRTFAGAWEEISYLRDKLLYWLYQRADTGKARRYAQRMERLLSRAAPDHDAVLGEECWALVYETKGDLGAAIQARENEVRQIRRLHELSHGASYEAIALKDYGYDDLSDRLDLLAGLYHDNGEFDKAITTLRESRKLCQEHGLEFNGEDMLQEYVEEKRNRTRRTHRKETALRDLRSESFFDPVSRRECTSVDLHHNLFYSYRGPNAEGADYDRQLENNLTKALINTLRLGGEDVWRPFLAKLGVADAHAAAFLLQRRDLPSGGAANKRRRVLLGISKYESAWSPDEHIEDAYESVPDAWVYGDGFAVLVESKVNEGDFAPGQMQAHLARLRSSELTPPRSALMTWGQIHGFFGGLLPNLNDAASRLLVAQFIQFLEYSGMSGFTGFRREHFDYFLLHEDDDARRWVREQMKGLATQVEAILLQFSPFYAEYDIGVLKLADTHCWVAFGPRDGAYSQVTHQSMSLASNGIRVYVNTELVSAAKRLKKVLRESADALRAALLAQHVLEPFELVVEERIRRQASLYDYFPKMRLYSSALAAEATGNVAWHAFSQMVQDLPLPYLRIERLVPARQLIELSKLDPLAAVQHVADILKHNHVVVNLLNG